MLADTRASDAVGVAAWAKSNAGTLRAFKDGVKAVALILWMLLFGRDSDGDERARNKQVSDPSAQQESKRSGTARKSNRALPVPWPMVCHFLVRVIDGPADTAVVVAKRDCPND